MIIEKNAIRDYWDTIVIGGGQSGLATGVYLRSYNIDFIILEASENVGDSWRNRWDSLQLFSPAWASSLPGLPFPGKQNAFPNKDEVADYIKMYSKEFDLPVYTKTPVLNLSKSGNRYQLVTPRGNYYCRNVVIAIGAYNVPKFPPFVSALSPSVFQLHSSTYKRPTDLPEGDVLVVGAGTSGLQIAIELAKSGRKTFVAGNPPAKIPDWVLDNFGKLAVWAMNNILTIKTKPGRKARQQIVKEGHGAPLIHVSVEDAEKAGIRMIPRIKEANNDGLITEDGKVIKPRNIIWCTGFAQDFSWINLNRVVGENNYPLAYRGISENHKGLYFMGMVFQYALTSSWLKGVGRDAKYIVKHIHEHAA